MAIAPKCTGFISLCASTFIVQHVLRDRKRRNLTYHRLLCGMSMSDMIGSFMCVLSTWPIPKGEAFLASGTVQTCSAQGFFNQTAALCTPTYNISLAIYYLLVVVRGWKEHRVAGLEKYLHAFPIAAGLGTGIAGLVLKLFNGAGWICWIAPGLPNHPERHNPNYGVFRLAFLYADAWAIILFLAATMAIIYFHVLKQERSLDKYVSSSFASKKRKQSRKIRNQAFLYVAALYMTWIFGSVSIGVANDGSLRSTEHVQYHVNYSCLLTVSLFSPFQFKHQTFRLMQFAGKKPPPAIIVLFVTFFPLQGFFNLVVYMFPRIHRHFEKGSVLKSLKSSTASFSSFRRSNMEKKRKKGRKETVALTSFTVESENRNSTLVSVSKETEHAKETRASEEGLASEVSFAPEVSLAPEPDAKAEDVEDNFCEDENAAGNVVDEDGDDAIDELAHIVEA